MSHNFLQVNLTKSDVVVLGLPTYRIPIMENLVELVTYAKTLARNVGYFWTRTCVITRHGLAHYISDLLSPYDPGCRLSWAFLAIPKARLKNNRRQGLCCQGP